MRDFTFHPEALVEFKAEVAYYEAITPGLGADFSERVFTIVDLARQFPAMGAPEGDGVRSLLTQRFPFVIYYEEVRATVFVWAVMHAAREPGYWHTRRT